MPYVIETAAAAQTDNELVAAPGANRQIEVLSYDLTTDVANTFTLESGTTNLRAKHFMAANASVLKSNGGDGIFRCAVNESLTWTTTGVGNTAVAVKFRFVRATGE